MEKTPEYYMKLDYTVEIQEMPSQYGGGYIATIPLLCAPGLAGWGDSPSKALASLEERKAEAFAEWLEEGAAIPEPTDDGYDGEISIILPAALHRKIAEIAQRETVDLNTCVVRLLTDAILMPQ